MSSFLSKIKARLESGPQSPSDHETGWVRVALASMEQDLVVEEMKSVSFDPWKPKPGAETAASFSVHGTLSSRCATERLWDKGQLDCVLPDGFCSIVPVSGRSQDGNPNPKLRFSPTPAAEDSTEAGSLDILLVDATRDKTLANLKEMCLEVVKGCESNVADSIRKVAGMVADFYGGPLFETGHTFCNEDDNKDGNVKLLGQVKIGLCRPRALLFKYLGDAVGLRSRIVMGLQLDSVPSTSLICSNPKKHLTNVVELNGKELLVDVMRHPGHLRPFTVKALVTYHISGPGDSDSAEYDSCDSPLEPNSPLFFGRVDGVSPSSEPEASNPRHNRRKSMSEEQANKPSPESQSEVRFFPRRHMVDGARSFPSSSPDNSVSRARAPSMLSGSRRTAEDEIEQASTSSPDDSPQYKDAPAGSFRRRSSSFCVREGAVPFEPRRSRKRSNNTPEVSDEVVRAVRAIKEAMKQVKRNADHESEGDRGTGSEPNSINLSVDATRLCKGLARSELESGSSSSVDSLLPNQAVMPYPEWNIDFSELRITTRVGIGSFGEVFRATWRGTEVAVKVMLEQDLTRENTEDFFNEVSILSRLRHPNVILFMGACTKPPNLSMVTEYMHMGSLYRLIHNNQGMGKKLSWRRKLKMLRDICRGLMCVQRMNIVHRDLKSANCLVDKHWALKICDFGLSRYTDGSPVQETTAAGTPEWMAPELLRNEPVTEKCDVFSLGVIMWELCTMKKPWEGVQPLQVLYEVSHNRARLEIPEGRLGSLISDCWEENPADRPSYDQILTRLHDCDYE